MVLLALYELEVFMKLENSVTFPLISLLDVNWKQHNLPTELVNPVVLNLFCILRGWCFQLSNYIFRDKEAIEIYVKW
jgi:hypothetical protein